jgi:hypothetical protein
MDKQSTRDWRFWGGWGLAFLGFPLGGLAASALVWAAGAATGGVGPVVEGALAGAATGAVVGAAQWLALSRRLPLAPRWIAATSAGAAVGMALGSGLLGTGAADSTVLLRALVTGAGIGLAQALALRDVTNRAPAWGVVVALGWVLGWVISSKVVGVDLGPWAVFGAGGALAYQLLTGLTLAWLLRRAHAVAPRLAPAV